MYLYTVSLSDPSLWRALTHHQDLLPSQARSRKDTTRHIVQSGQREQKQRSVLAVSPEQLQEAVQQAVVTADEQWQEAAAQMHQEDRNLAYTGSGRASGTTSARRGHKSGGRATAWKTRVLRRQHELEGLERCLQELCVCLFCTAWLTLGAIGEISGTDAQRDVDTDTAVPHAGDVVQRNCTNTSGECWSTGGPGGMEMLGPTSRTDLSDTQCGSAARALDLQLRGRDSVSNGTVRPRHRALSESKRRDLPREHPYRRYSADVDGWTTETTPCPQQCSVYDVGVTEGRVRQRQTRTGCCHLDTATNGPVWMPFRRANGAAKARERTKANPKTMFRQRHARSVARLVIGRKSAGTTFLVFWRKRTSPKARTRGKTTPANTPQQSIKDKKDVRCWNCNGQGHYSKDCPKKKQSFSAVEGQEQPSSSSGATGETTLSGFFSS